MGHGITGELRLQWQNTALQTQDTIAQLGICDGDYVYILVMCRPSFALVTDNAEVLDCGHIVRVCQDYHSSWGWATAFAASGTESLSIRLGPTAPSNMNVTDYFIGAMPDRMFKANSSQ